MLSSKFSNSILFNRSETFHEQENRLETYLTPSLATKSTPQSSTAPINSEARSQNPFEESYSPKTGVQIAFLLGGMLCLVICFIIWRTRVRPWCLSMFPILHRKRSTNPDHFSESTFDLDYWLKQVDILEAKEAERYRECVSPYLELPREEPRDNRAATASWIVDAWYQWHWAQSEKHQEIHEDEPNRNIAYQSRRRHHFLRRLYRRLLIPSEQLAPPVLLDQPSSMMGDLCSNIAESTTLPVNSTLNILQPPRRTASWPHLPLTQTFAGSPRSALQIQLARQKLHEHSIRMRIST